MHLHARQRRSRRQQRRSARAEKRKVRRIAGTSPGKTTAPAMAGNPIASKLAALSESMHLPNAPLKDAFTPGPSWYGSSTSDLRSFEQTHQLTGSILSGSHAAAFVDGKLLLVGQTVDGYKLMSVAKGRAVFQSSEASATLYAR